MTLPLLVNINSGRNANTLRGEPFHYSPAHYGAYNTHAFCTHWFELPCVALHYTCRACAYRAFALPHVRVYRARWRVVCALCWPLQLLSTRLSRAFSPAAPNVVSR